MKRDELTAAGLNDEQINVVMKLNGNDIEREKAKFADYDEIKAQLDKATATIDSMKDYDEVKNKIAEYQHEAEKARTEAAAKLQAMELQAKVKDFTSSKKFVNDLTRDAINAQLIDALNNDANKGKSYDDLLNEITDGKENIFSEENKPTPPAVPNMNGTGEKENGVIAAFKAMNPNLKL